jgi:amino acid transporter
VFRKFKHVLIGKPLQNEEIHGQKYTVFLGLPILSSDAISSVAYASEEILIVLIPAIGVLAYRELGFISAAIIALLLILTFSYRQTIHAYPNGGGSYIVASDNLGVIPGVIAGASLAVDYILTVAVSISSGTAAITSAFPSLYHYTVPICLILLLFIMLGNLRGIRESSLLFSIPPYIFILTMVITIVVGIVRYLSGDVISTAASSVAVPVATESLSLVLILTAFSNGCSALTGVEAVSNAIPNFKKPQVKNAQRVLLLLSLFILIIFGGVSILANLYHAIPTEGNTVLSQIALAIYGKSPMYYVVQATTAIILLMAANTSYSDFPLLMSLISRDGFAPRQLSHRGDRLSFSNGIIVLSVVAAILIIIFRGSTNRLIPLYAIGVFISFTLSQFGMFKHWLKKREDHWVHKAVINGVGALVTAVVVLIIAYTKFPKGAWVVIVIIPLLVITMLKVKKHYNSVAKQLKMEQEEIESSDIDNFRYRNRVIVPIDSLNKASIRALKYAKTISDNIVAFNVSIDAESGEKVRKNFARLHCNIPLKVQYSPYRKIAEPLLRFIDSEEYNYEEDDVITVILPEFEVSKPWQRILHNSSGRHLSNMLMKYHHIVVARMPFHLTGEGLLFSETRKKPTGSLR